MLELAKQNNRKWVPFVGFAENLYVESNSFVENRKYLPKSK